MAAVLFIGLPTQIRQRLEAFARARKVELDSILIGLGQEATLQLLPKPEQAINMLRAYLDKLDNAYNEAYVLVLPYAPIPVELDEEMEALDAVGGKIVRAVEGEEGWPNLGGEKIDTPFSNQLYDKLLLEVFGVAAPVAQTAPAEYFRQASARSPRLIIAEGALDRCDEIAVHRYSFMRKVADAFVKIIEAEGQVGTFKEFFGDLGLAHAQSGGITTTLTVNKGTECVLNKQSSNTHLKQGDNTTPQAAARVYYQVFFMNSECHVAIIYAGPHPDVDILCVHNL